MARVISTAAWLATFWALAAHPEAVGHWTGTVLLIVQETVMKGMLG